MCLDALPNHAFEFKSFTVFQCRFLLMSFKRNCKLYPQVEAFLPYALPSSLSKSFSVRFEILGFFLKMVESNAAVVWDGFVFTLRGRLVGWIYLYISYQSVLA